MHVHNGHIWRHHSRFLHFFILVRRFGGTASEGRGLDHVLGGEFNKVDHGASSSSARLKVSANRLTVIHFSFRNHLRPGVNTTSRSSGTGVCVKAAQQPDVCALCWLMTPEEVNPLNVFMWFFVVSLERRSNCFYTIWRLMSKPP